MKSNSMLPIKHEQSLDFLDGPPESLQEHCQKSRRTLKSPWEQESAPGTPNQLEMRSHSPALALESSRKPIKPNKCLHFP